MCVYELHFISNLFSFRLIIFNLVYTCYWHLVDKQKSQRLINSYKSHLAGSQGHNWHSCCNQMMEEVPIERIYDSVSKLPLAPGVLQLLKSINSKNYIVSDSNRRFIAILLNAHGLEDYFSGIFTNDFDEQTKTIITYEIAFHSKRSNNCKNCSRDHMCKGDVVEKLMEKHVDSIFYYFGDGENDHCPMKIIGEKSVNKCFCRKGFSLEQALIRSPLQHVTLYSDASEILDNISS